jgi:hypothetical protein
MDNISTTIAELSDFLAGRLARWPAMRLTDAELDDLDDVQKIFREIIRDIDNARMSRRSPRTRRPPK